ncbi:centromere protein X isoform X2 [Physeter macrocephalus]|uniref:Centromere protein X n=1 Tax=Physeter macrocephalus TaxID=9755 RepID=A0A2Y9FKH4_PHYMC|nr:centromere protein X isoform X2 [Physeter catodon]|eukprot:XP_007125673.1 centromere protein X isoform X2 [Physeter catodon]
MILVPHTFRSPWMGSRGRVAEGLVGNLVCGKRERVCRNRAGELVSKLLHLHFKDDKTKVSGDALRLMAELLKIFVVEAAIRSIRQAQAEDLAQVDVEQLEKVLPQLLLDF